MVGTTSPAVRSVGTVALRVPVVVLAKTRVSQLLVEPAPGGAMMALVVWVPTSPGKTVSVAESKGGEKAPPAPASREDHSRTVVITVSPSFRTKAVTSASSLSELRVMRPGCGIPSRKTL